MLKVQLNKLTVKFLFLLLASFLPTVVTTCVVCVLPRMCVCPTALVYAREGGSPY